MKFTAWVELRDDFAFPADNPEDDTELQAKNRETLEKCGDIEVIPFVFKARNQANRTWRVYSLLYDIDDSISNQDQAIEQALERFKSENPGKTDVLACWRETGEMVGCTLVVDPSTGERSQTGVPLYPTPGYLLSYMPDVDGAPAQELVDAHTYMGLPPKVME